MANVKKSVRFGGGSSSGSVPAAAKPRPKWKARTVTLTAFEARVQAMRDAHVARCAYCASREGLRFVEVVSLGACDAPAPARENCPACDGLDTEAQRAAAHALFHPEHRYTFQWMCAVCRQLDLPF
jgi:hypothetical protein